MLENEQNDNEELIEEEEVVEEPAEAIEDGEQVEPGEGDEDGGDEEIAPDTLFPIPFTDEEGYETIIEVPYSEIVQAIATVRSDELKKQRDFINVAYPVIERVMSNKILKGLNEFYAAGYSDEQIYRMMPEVLSKIVPEYNEAPTPVPTNDPAEYVKSLVQQALTPIQKEQETLRQQNAKKAIIENNEAVMGAALRRHGLDSKLTEDDFKVLRKTWADAYPGTDFGSYKITQQQAYILVNDAVGKMPSAKKKKTAPNAGKIQGAMQQAKAPSIISGKVTSSLKAQKPAPRSNKPVTTEERYDRFNKLLFQ